MPALLAQRPLRRPPRMPLRRLACLYRRHSALPTGNRSAASRRRRTPVRALRMNTRRVLSPRPASPALAHRYMHFSAMPSGKEGEKRANTLVANSVKKANDSSQLRPPAWRAVFAQREPCLFREARDNRRASPRSCGAGSVLKAQSSPGALVQKRGRFVRKYAR